MSLGAWLRRDLDGLRGVLAPPAPPAPGLYVYRVALPGGRRRLHLRVEEDGAGVLFVDVTDVIHLNATAAEMAKLALDGVPLERARSGLLARYGRGVRERLGRELGDVYALVERLRRAGDGCSTCDAKLERSALFSTRARAPFKADVVLTYGCNNACPHCYNEPDRLAMPSLPKPDWIRVLDRLAAIGVPHVIFTGGEATLHPHLLEMVAHAEGLGQVAGLNTNGRRLAHRAYADGLVEAGLDHVQVTLGSSRPEVHDAMNGAPGAWRQTVRGIENALASPIHTITNTTLTRANAGHAEEIVDFLHALGIRTFAMNGTIYSGGGFADPQAIPEEELPALLVGVRDRAAELGMRLLWYTPTEYCRMSPVELEIGAKRCNAGEYSIAVEPSGDVLPCQSFYVSAGNILRDPWEAIWNGALFRSFREREELLGESGLPEKCWDCPDLPLCGGGCRIEREAREGRRTAATACAGCAPRSDGATSFVPTSALVRTPLRASRTAREEAPCPR